MLPGPILSGDKVRLQPFRAADITPAYLSWLNDPEVVRYSNQRFRQHDESSCRAYLASFAGSANLFLSIQRLDDKRPVGTMTCYRSMPHGTADIGIMLGERQCWGQGLGLDAWTTLMGWLALQPGMRKITGGTLDANIGMRKIMERAGMQLEAVRRAQEILDGEPRDIVLYAKFLDR
ncbi:GNAT family protein [Devosia sp.]|uniref:GNAT family N-acetyltransferase n=1 Tax=Devosia sp. TaxID=1871048 RepID=UPI002B0027A7|nr:GNAT family protein [Devosia sp.]